MKKIFERLLVSAIFFGCSMSVNALTETPKFDGLFYYQIGGAKPLSIPPAPILTSINLNFSISPTGLACGNFDPGVSIENFFDDLKDGADEMLVAMENVATAAIASLPGYLLQKANPGLYDIFQNGLLRGWGKFTLATKSCELMAQQISQGVDPYEKWITASAGDEWKISAGTGGTDIVNVKDEIEANKGESGKRWIGGVSCGGRDQNPCKPLRDTVLAGFNISLNRSVMDTSAVPITSSSPELAQLFSDPDDVMKWVFDVLGDDEIVTCQGCTPGSQPGRGLIPLIAEREEEMETQLRQIVLGAAGGGINPTRDNLEVVAAPGVGISVHDITAIREFNDDSERGMVISKLASEIATAQILEEALIIRRLLLTGSKEGNVKGIGMAQDQILAGVAELESEIANVQFEKEVRDAWVSHTVTAVLEKSRSFNTSSRAIRPRVETRNDKFEYGRVEP